MKISWIKLENDKKNFKIPEMLGLDVFYIKDYDTIDTKIDELISNNYNKIIISKDLAGFSQKINYDYINNKNVDIIINYR